MSMDRPGIFPELLQYEKEARGIVAGSAEAATTTERLCRRFLDACERRYGKRSSEAAEASGALAANLFYQGDTAEGIALMRVAIEIREHAHDSDSVARTCDLFLLAEFLECAQRFAEALPLIEQALTIHKRASGADHPDTVLALQRLAELHAALGHPREATAFGEQARLARTAKHSETPPATPEWPQLFRPHKHCGERLLATGDFAAAKFHFERAVTLRPEFGENHNNLGTACFSLAENAASLGHDEEAKEFMKIAVEQFTEACGMVPHATAIHANLANALAAAGRFDEAASKYHDVLQKEPNNPELLNNYGVALFRGGHKHEAVVQFRKALAVDPNLRHARESLAMALEEDAPASSP